MKFIKKMYHFCVYAGEQAVETHRLSHWLWNHNLKFVARFVTRINRFLTGIEIEPEAILSRHVKISHGMGTVIGGNCIIGKHVVIRQNVTLGGKDDRKEGPNIQVHPIVEDHVSIGAGAVIIGAITIGHHSIIGANSVVTKDIPPYSVAAGVPAKIIKTMTDK